MAASDTDFKQQVLRLIDTLPPQATWEDLQYAIYVRMAIEAGEAAADAGRKVSDDEVCRRFGLSSRNTTS